MTYRANFRASELNSPLLQADVLAPLEYFETSTRKTAEIEPEKRLMLAVLVDAIATYQDYISHKTIISKDKFQEVEDWIMEQNTEWPFSFENICEILGFNPQYIRLGLRRWKERSQGELA